MPFDSIAFMNDILKDVNVSDSDKAALEATLKNPVVARRLEEGQLRQSDFSKKQDELGKKMQAAQDYWDGLVKWDKEAKIALENEKKQIKQQRIEQGLDVDNSTGDTKTNYQEELRKLATESVAYMNAISTLGMRHFKEFGEILDTSKLLEVAQKEGVNVSIAWERMVQPKREEIQKADFEKQLAAARLEGKEEALKNVNIPVMEQQFGNMVPSSLDNLGKSDKKEYSSLAAIEAWKAHRRGNTPLPF